MTTVAKKLDLPPLIELRDQLLSRLPGIIRHIVMYGSYAQGEAKENSNVDVLVVVEEASPDVIEETRAVRYEVMARYE